MEFEQVKAKNQELSPPPSNSPNEIDTDDDKRGPLDNPSTKPEANGRVSSLEEPVSSQVVTSASPYVETATQVSPPEPTEMKSPPIQVMGQPPGYDPNRIPASVFATKSGSPGDWSATSNESLFSIHMGNNSFSRDYALLFGKSGEIPKFEDWNSPQMNPFLKSGELPRLDEWNNASQLPNNRPTTQGKSSDFGSLPPVMEDPWHEESSVQSNEFPKVEKKVKETVAKKPPIPETNTSSFSTPTSMPSPRRLSDVSGHSGSSFAFPVLGDNDSGKHESVKVVSERLEKPDQQPHSINQEQNSKETPTGASGTRWFSCLSCWPRFC